MWQMLNAVDGINVVKEHGLLDGKATQFFHYRDFRDIVCCHAKRAPEIKKHFVKCQKEGILKSLRLFTTHSKYGFNSILKARKHGCVRLVRYEDFLPSNNEAMLQFAYDCLIYDGYDIKLDKEQLIDIASKFTIEKNYLAMPNEDNFNIHKKHLHENHISNWGMSHWKDLLDDELKARFKKEIGKLLIEFNYEHDINW